LSPEKAANLLCILVIDLAMIARVDADATTVGGSRKSVELWPIKKRERMTSANKGPVNLDPTVIRSWPAIRRYWRHLRQDCARCGKPIQYDEPRYKVIIENGRKRRIENPWALDVGHIIDVLLDPRFTGKYITTGLIWAPIDTQPEHAVCNRRAGAAMGNAKRKKETRKIMPPVPPLKTSREW
jgi:hypothetical protein